jgi:hypothetical protein
MHSDFPNALYNTTPTKCTALLYITCNQNVPTPTCLDSLPVICMEWTLFVCIKDTFCELTQHFEYPNLNSGPPAWEIWGRPVCNRIKFYYSKPVAQHWNQNHLFLYMTGTKHRQWNLQLGTTLVTEQVCVQRFTESSTNIAKAELN